MTDTEAFQPLALEARYTGTAQSQQFERELEQSLHPRGPDMLFDTIADLDLGPRNTILDVGSGTGWAACRLAERTPAQVVCIDVVPSLLATARKAVQDAGLQQRITVREASILAIPLEPGSVDLVWCRDMLGDGFPIAPALRECHRVLRSGGAMLVYKTFAGDLLEPKDAARLYRGLGGDAPQEERPEHAEHAFRDAGFRIERKDVIGGELREYEIEHGEHSPRHGLYASRLLRREDYFVRKYGRPLYEQALADALWLPFIMLGKLLPVAYLLRKDGGGARIEAAGT